MSASYLRDTLSSVLAELERLDPTSVVAARARGALDVLSLRPSPVAANREARSANTSHDDQIAELYQSGLTLERTAKASGISVPTIIAALDRKGIRRRRRGRESLIGGITKQNAERTERVRAMRAEGKTLEEIGAAEGITRERVRQLCVKAGIDTRRRNLTSQELTMVDEYLSGQSLDAVACAHGVSVSILTRALFQAGHKPRPCKKRREREPRTIANAERAAQMYNAGKTGREIAAALGVANETGVYRLLNIAGCPRARRPASQSVAA